MLIGRMSTHSMSSLTNLAAAFLPGGIGVCSTDGGRLHLLTLAILLFLLASLDLSTQTHVKQEGDL